MTSRGGWEKDWEIDKYDLISLPSFGVWSNEVNGEKETIMNDEEYKLRYADWEGGGPTVITGDDMPDFGDHDNNELASTEAPDLYSSKYEHGTHDLDDRSRRVKPVPERSGVGIVDRNERWAARRRKAERNRAKSEEREEFIDDQIISDRKSQIDALRTAYERAAEAVDAVATNLIDHPGGPFTAATIENLQNAAMALGPLGDEIRKWETHQIEIARGADD